MGSLVAFFLLAAAAPDGAQALSMPGPAKAAASARATVRILPGVRVSLSRQAEAQGHKLNQATVTLEDGSRRPAQLVEFQ